MPDTLKFYSVTTLQRRRGQTPLERKAVVYATNDNNAKDMAVIRHRTAFDQPVTAQVYVTSCHLAEPNLAKIGSA